MPSPASSPVIRRYPQCSLSAAMRNTRRTTWRWVGGRPGLFGLDLAAQRRRTISRCQRRIVPGVMNECNAPWHERGMSVSSAANNARSVHVSFGRAAVCRCRTASWWRSRRISASFHADGRLDSLSHAGIWTVRRNTKRRHTRRDNRRPGCLTASRTHPDDLPVRGFQQPQVSSAQHGPAINRPIRIRCGPLAASPAATTAHKIRLRRHRRRCSTRAAPTPAPIVRQGRQAQPATGSAR